MEEARSTTRVLGWIITDKTAAHFVVYSSESPIGAGRIRETSDGIGKVERVCVLGEYRGKIWEILLCMHLKNMRKRQACKKSY